MKYWARWIGIAAAAFFIMTQEASAEVYTVEESFALEGCVYVAGNPDLYPLEYYNSDTKSYEGIMPEILERVSDKTGVDFVYIEGGVKDKRMQLAQNTQVELVSGCIQREELPEELELGNAIYTLTIDGVEYEVSFGYTEAATEMMKKAVEDEVHALQQSAAGNLAVSVMYRLGWNRRRTIGLLVLVAGGAVLLTGVLGVWLLWARKQRKKNKIRMFQDEVTGYGNKAYFRHKFVTGLPSQNPPCCAMIYIGFDIRKSSEADGEAASAEILRCAADIIAGELGEKDFFAHVADGEYAAVYQCVSQEEAADWTDRVLRRMNTESGKLENNYTPVFSAGIYQLENREITCDEALNRAKRGYLYADANGHRFIICDEKQMKKIQQEKEIQKQCSQAVRNREFVCYVQFAKNIKNGTICGAEVLSRWEHPERGLLKPGTYIAEMEKNGTIVELDFYMLEESCKLLNILRQRGCHEIFLFCNLSRKTLSSAEFEERMEQILERNPIDCSNICLEVTKSIEFDNEKTAFENVHICREKGFMFALDDVGGGYLPLADLNEYPVDIAKFDRELLLAASEAKGRRLLKGMNSLFHSIRVRTLCEGIETKEQYDLMEAMGIDYIQGYYIQRVLPAKEAVCWIEKMVK